MRYIILASVMALPLPLVAQEGPWVALTGAEIKEALSERTLKFSSATQKFYASGKTLYDSGRPSWGYWRVEGDAYCSQWPPNDLWTCYGMDRRAGMVRFVGERDDVTEGVYVDQE